MPESIISQGDLDYYEKYKAVIENFLHLPGYSEERKTNIRNIPHLLEFKRMNYQEKFTRELDECRERFKHLWSQMKNITINMPPEHLPTAAKFRYESGKREC